MIDLRSDTVSTPTPAMRDAMARAEVGDDVFGDDPTVNRLEQMAADLLGKQDALFVPSGTQSNLCALLAHCQRGDEYIVGDGAHTYRYEAGGAAVLGSIQPQPVATQPDGMVDLAAAEAAIKPDDHHFARSRLLCIENTKDGKVLSLAQMRAAGDLAARRGLGAHLDGARLFNAAVSLGIDASELADPFDTVSVCLSKGLGAPVGSVLTGPSDLIGEAHKWRKMLGGGMRQAGIIAAAGIHALEHNIERLADDHRHAHRLADGLGAIDEIEVTACDTNMVFIRITDTQIDLSAALEGAGVRTLWNEGSCRLVTHLDVDTADIDAAITAFADVLAAR